MPTWTPQQFAIYDWAKTGDGNLVVTARAGSGKTSTMVEMIKQVPMHKTVLFAAFNKHSAEDLQNKIGAGNPNRVAKTLHALGFQILRERLGNVKLDKNRTKTLVQQVMGKGKFSWKMATLVDRIKDAAPWAEDPETVILHGKRLEVLLDPEKELPHKEQADIVLQVFDLTERQLTPEISYSDMVFLPYRKRWPPLNPFDWVIVDEVQDATPGQIDIALRAGKDKGRFVAVGDEFQVLYQFRGAELNAMANLVTELNAKTLPLTVTFRCSKAVVHEARRLVPDIQVLKSAPEGSVDRITTDEMLIAIEDVVADKTQPMDIFVLSRLNAPLFPLGLKLLKKKIPFTFQGRDFGEKVVELASDLHPRNREDLDLKLKLWQQKKLKGIPVHTEDPDELRLVADIKDIVEAVRVVADHCNSNVDQIEMTIRQMFEREGTRGVTLSTVHRAKGLEADIVFLLEGSFPAHNPDLKLKVTQGEHNIEYVGITRAKTELWWVEYDPETFWGRSRDLA